MLKKINALACLLCLVLLGTAYYIQYNLHIEPCSLCLMQRLFFFLLTIVFFIALCHRYQHMMAQRVYGMLIILFSGLGLAASLRQVWLQYVSTGEPADCGASLSYMLTHFPLRDTLMSIFNGSGDCADIVMRIGGFSMAQWSTFFFILFFIAGLYFIMKRNT